MDKDPVSVPSDAAARRSSCQKQHEKALQKTKLRMNSLLGIKVSANMRNCERTEKLLAERSRKVLDSLPMQKFQRSLHVVRTAVRFKSLTRDKQNARQKFPTAAAGNQPRDRPRKLPLVDVSNSLSHTRRRSDIGKPPAVVPLLLARDPSGRRESDVVSGCSRISMYTMARMGARRPTNAELETDTVTWAALRMKAIFKRFKRPGEAKRLFARSVRKIIILIRWKDVLREIARNTESEFKTFMDIATDFVCEENAVSIEEKSGLEFDPKCFKADREVKLTVETTLTLTLPVESRSPESVRRALTELEVIQAFTEYPLHMQEKLAKTAWCQEVDAKKMILKEGHYAESFYFILSGSAIVKKLLMDEATGQPQLAVVGRLTSGQCFGEIALLHHSMRTASVESLTKMQLLVIDRDDFANIFMMEGQDGGEAEHISHLRTRATFLKHWPVEVLRDHKDWCLFNYFRRGNVVVHDSRRSDWIYIVKSGSCTVLKRLQCVRPRPSEVRTTTPERLQLPKIRTADMDLTDKQSSAPVTWLPTLSAARQREPPGEGITAIDLETMTEDATRDVTPDKPDGPVQTRHTTSRSSDNRPGYSPSKMWLPPRMSRQHHRNNTEGSKFTERPIESDKDDVEPSPCFIQLKKLVPGHTFGLEDVELDNDPCDVQPTSVTLVSNGAELILLSKKVFLKYANEKVQLYVREHRQRYPTEDALQDNLQSEVNWRSYRKHVINDFLRNGTHLDGLPSVTAI